MKGKQYIYGTFEQIEDCQKALAQLKKTGLPGALIVKNKGLDFPVIPVEIKIEKERFFMVAGCIGAIIGGLAGAIASPTLAMADTYQVLTPVMAAITGAALGGYTGVIISAFLNANNKDAFAMEVFEGNIANGCSILAVPVKTKEEKLLSFKCIEAFQPSEIIIRTGQLGPLDWHDKKVETAQATPVAIVA